VKKEEIKKTAEIAEFFAMKCRRYLELRALNPLVKQNGLSRSIRRTSNELTTQLPKMRAS